MFNNLKKRTGLVFLAGVLLAGVFFVGRAAIVRAPADESSSIASGSYPELTDIADKSLSFGELSSFFKKLAREKGAEYAFGALKVAKLPPDTDLHLLGHVVGDELYKQKGLQGITVCTNDFRNACSHTIVIGLLMEKGEGALPTIAQACAQAPGGSGAYTMCFHGLGHGVLAYAEYDLTRAVVMCEKTGTRGEAPQCIGGVIMEMISGGGHNRALWETKRTVFLKKDTPLASCQNKAMPADGRIFCLIYITPYLWEAAGADIGNPTSKDFSASFKFCDMLTADDAAGRDACFGGFGKEFTTLANNRDIRNVDQMDDTQMRQVYDWCGIAHDKNAIAACVASVMNSLYWGGENKPAGAIRFCNVISDEFQQRSCFMNLITSVQTYQSDAEYRHEFCKATPAQYQEECGSVLR